MLSALRSGSRAAALTRMCASSERVRTQTAASTSSTQPLTASQPAAKPRVLVLAGPTASGKTALSLALAHALNGEVISADSVQARACSAVRCGTPAALPRAQVYTGLDVGSAKLAVGERQGVPHHLLDLLPPTLEFSAGDWVDAALQAAGEVIARGRVPIVVGGAGFHLRWLTCGKPPTPKSDQGVSAAARADLLRCADQGEAALLASTPEASPQQREVARWNAAAQLLASEGAWSAAHGEPQLTRSTFISGDPASAASLARNDFYRAERCLEILRVTGQPVSTFQADGGASRAYDFRCFHLAVPRVQLYRRIDARCEAMLAGGLLPEAAHLWRLGARPGDQGCSASPAGRSIGYAQALQLLAASLQAQGERGACHAALLACLAEFQARSRNYAKRQHTWFRGEERYRWVDTRAGQQAALQEVLHHFAEEQHQACARAADEVLRADAGEGAQGGDPRAVQKARNKALACYATHPSGALHTEHVERLLDWLQRWAQEQGASVAC